MDRIGLRELLRAGVSEIRDALVPYRENRLLGASEDARIGSLLDRIAQVGVITAEHDVSDAWNDVLESFSEIVQLGRPTSEGLGQVAAGEATYQLEVAERLLLLGAHARVLRRFERAKDLALLHPVTDYASYYWSRYSVTMISRGKVDGWKKSLIGPSSDYVRARPQYFRLFQENMDVVVNAMCQFDFFQCVVVMLATGSDTRLVYPNFGAYWNRRTVPMAKEMIRNPSVRAIVGGPTDSELRAVFQLLDDSAGRAFFDFNGWDSRQWDDPEVEQFVNSISG